MLAGVVVGMLGLGGQRAWRDYQSYQQLRRESEDTVPIGYVGLNFRRSYNDRPARFHHEQGGRKLLWAALGEGNKPDFYDVTDAAFNLRSLSGGYGRDSIPGVDYPIFESRSSERGQRLRERQELWPGPRRRSPCLSGGPPEEDEDVGQIIRSPRRRGRGASGGCRGRAPWRS